MSVRGFFGHGISMRPYHARVLLSPNGKTSIYRGSGGVRRLVRDREIQMYERER